MPKRKLELENAEQSKKALKASDQSLTDALKDADTASDCRQHIKRSSELTHQFEYHDEKYILSVENKEQGKAYYEKLNKNLKKLDIGQDLFNWNQNDHTITISLPDFIQWVNKLISYKSATYIVPIKKKIFFKGNNCYFTPGSSKYSLDAYARRNKLDVNFKINYNLNIIEISEEDYTKFNEYRNQDISKKQHQFVFDQQNDIGRISFTILSDCISKLKKLKLLAQKYTCSPDIFRMENNEIIVSSIDLETYNNKKIEHEAKKRKAFGVPLFLNKQTNTYYCKEKIKKREFQRLAELLNIDVNFFDINRRPNLSCEDYEKWIANPLIKNSYHSSIKRDDNSIFQDNGDIKNYSQFVYNEEEDNWELKLQSVANIGRRLELLVRQCKEIGLPETTFKRRLNTIIVSDANYQTHNEKMLEYKAKKLKGYGKRFILDKSENIYISHDKIYGDINQFKSLARLLKIQVEFKPSNNHAILSVKDYQKWIADPIIRKSYDMPLLELNNVNNSLPKRIKKEAQTISNTTGGISAKYLKDAFAIPFDISNNNIGPNETLTEKGHILPFQSLRDMLNQKRKGFVLQKEIELTGIKTKLTFYFSARQTLSEIFSKNVIFVRSGRKEQALIPKLEKKSNCSIIILISANEYKALTQTIKGDPRRRLATNHILCVINSCEADNQLEKQSESYQNTSNIKRIVAFTLARKYKAKDFILMDDNTLQIQLSEKLSKNNTVDSLFELFRLYQQTGTVCATLGSYSAYKNIVSPLEATQLENLKIKLGSKIMYIDFETLNKKLDEKNIPLYELFSPCSLWWGEDYFNMLSLIHAFKDDEKPNLLGVLPYSVAWHIRSQACVNQTKKQCHFKMANVWVNEENQELFSELTEHQKPVVLALQKIVRKAIKDQIRKEELYLNKLQAEFNINDNNQIEEENLASNIIITKVHSQAYLRGAELALKSANRGYELIPAKLQEAASNEYLDEADEKNYIEGFTQAHQKRWAELSQDARAFGRGYQEGYAAAIKGYEFIDKLMKAIPAPYQNNQKIYERGFKCGYNIQWNLMSDLEKSTAIAERIKKEMMREVLIEAEKLGFARAKSGFEPKGEKLDALAEQYKEHKELFKQTYMAAFYGEWSKMTQEEIIKLQAEHFAKELSAKNNDINISALNKIASSKHIYATLYYETVIKKFDQLKKCSVNCERSVKTKNQ